MYIKSLQLKNFRNYERQAVEFNECLNFFVGRNAQGKTNLLEAVHFTCLGRSPRTPRDKELIMEGKDFAEVSVKVRGKAGTSTIDIYLDKKANKRIAINRLPIHRLGELMGTAACVYFSPDEIRIIKEGPSERRKLLDIALCQMSRTYFYLLSNYNKVLMQRNKLIKSGNFTDDSLEIWTNQLVDYGAKIIKTRKGMVRRLAVLAMESHSFITGGNERLSVLFESVDGETVDEIAFCLTQKYKEDKERDIKLGYTHSGPHKDDLKIMVGDMDVRAFGSQGQQRSAALSLKLAELEIIKEETGDSPILILDDVFSELDKSRRDNLIGRLDGIQTLISCTDREYTCGKNASVFTVEKGKIVL